MYQRDGRFLAHANSEITVSLCSTRRLIMPSCGTPPSFLSADWLCSPSVPPIPRFLSLPIIIVLPVCLPTAVCHVSSSNLRDSGIQKFRSRSQTSAKNIAAIPRKLSCSRGDFFVIPDHCSLVCVRVCVYLKGIVRFLFDVVYGFEKYDISSRNFVRANNVYFVIELRTRIFYSGTSQTLRKVVEVGEKLPKVKVAVVFSQDDVDTFLFIFFSTRISIVQLLKNVN